MLSIDTSGLNVQKGRFALAIHLLHVHQLARFGQRGGSQACSLVPLQGEQLQETMLQWLKSSATQCSTAQHSIGQCRFSQHAATVSHCSVAVTDHRNTH